MWLPTRRTIVEMGSDNRGMGDDVDIHGAARNSHERVRTRMEQSAIREYSMSVICRALPDVRDGLTVHRRILYAMNEAGNLPNKPASPPGPSARSS